MFSVGMYNVCVCVYSLVQGLSWDKAGDEEVLGEEWDKKTVGFKTLIRKGPQIEHLFYIHLSIYLSIY